MKDFKLFVRVDDTSMSAQIRIHESGHVRAEINQKDQFCCQLVGGEGGILTSLNG